MGNNGSHGDAATLAANSDAASKELVEKIAAKSKKFSEKQSAEMEHLRERVLKMECKMEVMERMVQCLVQLLAVFGAGFMGVICWLAIRSSPTVRIESSQLSGM